MKSSLLKGHESTHLIGRTLYKSQDGSSACQQEGTLLGLNSHVNFEIISVSIPKGRRALCNKKSNKRFHGSAVAYPFTS